MIEIRKEFPFAFCEKCNKREIRTEETKMFSFDEVVLEELTISCTKEGTCRYLIDIINRNGMIH